MWHCVVLCGTVWFLLKGSKKDPEEELQLKDPEEELLRRVL